jgi:hypothetical protein
LEGLIRWTGSGTSAGETLRERMENGFAAPRLPSLPALPAVNVPSLDRATTARGAPRAWWSGTAAEFLQARDADILGTLAVRLVETHPLNRATQLMAWQRQVALLRHALDAMSNADPWRVLLEYPLLRLGRRIDAVLVSDRAIIVLEFKIGATSFQPPDRAQAEDYALDLFDFHAASRGHPIIPILVASEAIARPVAWPLFWHGVAQVLDASGASLRSLLAELADRVPVPAQPLHPALWEHAAYRPVPTIVEAATMLYARHGVADIAAARADLPNLTRTTNAIRDAIAEARAGRHHLVVFITGIPGAGKTLCGLNAVFGAEDGAAFLTGNLPLVHVLREALARDAASGTGSESLRVARHRTESAIQPLLGFLRDNVTRSAPPHEAIIVFDEAQRAWDAAFGKRKFGLDGSEAALFLDIMRRHKDFAVIVALVGNGQEINTGEAGLAEWGRALAARPDWHVRAAPGVLTATDPRQRLTDGALQRLVIDPALHLDVPVRSIRSAAGARWVDAVLAGEEQAAAAIAAEAGGLPFLLTRSLPVLRATLRDMARGRRRAGLICSAGARRLRADGLWPDFPHLDANAVADWFLNSWPDVRASDALEMPATQFACQGLELDHVGLCWGGDLIRRGGGDGWTARSFRGTRWTEMRNEAARAYRLNTYRVLLTRARYETVIWVPQGDSSDPTRDPATLDGIAAFLLSCGATELESSEQPLHPAPLTPEGCLL